MCVQYYYIFNVVKEN